MKKSRILVLLSVAVMLFVSAAATVTYKSMHELEIKNSYSESLLKAPLEKNPLLYINEDFTIKEGFSSHLPLVIIDTNGVEPPINARINKEGVFEDISDVQPYVDGNIYIVDNANQVNHFNDKPKHHSKMIIKRRGNSSMMYDKAQWLMKFTTDSGQNNEVDVLGMGEHHEWILNGSMADKSMLRNYLAYSLSSEIMPYTPDSRYCEVLIKNGDKYSYQGLYLMMESISQDINRVNIAEYRQRKAFNSYLARRDRYDKNGTMLDTYGRMLGQSSEYIGLLYPTKSKVSKDMIRYAETDISLVETILYSKDMSVYSAYPKYIDVNSFTDYFIINEFFASYDAGNFSTYFYKDLGGKLTMGPVWDFDGTIDNYFERPLDIDALAFQTKPWFKQLCMDNTFISKLESRYALLRRTTLSDENVIGKIDEITAHIGGAKDREWNRWRYIYEGENVKMGTATLTLQPYIDEDGYVIERDAKSYDQEIYRIKTALRKHAQAIPYQLELLHKSARLKTGISNYKDFILILTMLLFLIPTVFICYKK